jgi:carboxypeptidase Taq
LPPPELVDLRALLAEIRDLDRARAVLEWDERTMMPPGGAAARAEQIATLTRLRHERLRSDVLGRLVDVLSSFGEDIPYDSDEASLVRVARRDHRKAVRVPTRLKTDLAHASVTGEHAWREARARDDFSHFLPHLERNLELKHQYVRCFDAEDPYDPLLDDFEPGMRTAEIELMLEELKAELVPFVAAVRERGDGIDDSPLRGSFPVERQRALVAELLHSLPMPKGEWRLDEAAHPFATAFSPSDVRITTRYNETDIAEAIFGTLHEYGHGLYENGIAPELDRTPLCHAASLGLNESQSRMWENRVGRSRAFWRRFHRTVEEAFPEQLGGVGPERLYRALNKVEPSLIRVDADEVTYDLHVLVRFELERELISGRLAAADLPEAWNARVHSYLGIEVPSDAVGVLQDVHWAEGLFGYFPTYSLGNVISAQLWEAIAAAIPDLDERIERGELDALRDWLREHVHRHGRKLTAGEIVREATGREAEVGPYVRYLKEKYGELYALAPA